MTASPTGPVRKSGLESPAVSALAYAAILLLLFHRLLVGEVFRSGALINDWVPFQAYGEKGWSRYVSGTHQDIWRQFAPFEQYQHESFYRGNFPTWNPHIFCGMPFHANAQAAMLNPFRCIYFLVDPDFARGPMAVLRLLVSVLFMNLLVRRLGLGGEAALVVGICWMLAAFNIRWLAWSHTNASLWLPVVLYALDKTVHQPGWRTLGAAGLACTVFQLSGHPETQFQTGCMAGLFVVCRVIQLRCGLPATLFRLGLAFAAMVLGVKGAAVALFPFLIQMVQSADWQESLRSAAGPFPASVLMLFLAPDMYGRPRSRFEYYGPETYNETALFIGLIPLALALATVVCLKKLWVGDHRQLRLLGCYGTILVVVCAMTVFGVWPLSQIARSVPLLGQCNPLRFVLGIQLGATLLAGVGWELIRANGSAGFRWLVFMILGAFALFIAILPTVSAPPGYDPQDLPFGWIHHTATRIRASLISSIVFSAVSGALALWHWRRRCVAPPWRVALILLIAADLLWASWDFNPITPESIADPPPPATLVRLRERLQSQRLVATDYVLCPNLSMRYDFRDVRGYDYPVETRLARVLRSLRLRLDVTVIGSQRFFPEIDPRLAAFLDRAAVRFLYSDRGKPSMPVGGSPGDRLPWVRLEGPEWADGVYRNPNAYPRAWFAKSFNRGGADQAIAHLLDPGIDLRELSIVEDQDSLRNSAPRWPAGMDQRQAANGSGAAAGQIGRGTVQLVEDLPERVVLRSQSDTGGLLVLSDRMDLGWRVQIDGNPADALYANFMFRGVVVPPGAHEVVWTYHCPGLMLGFVVSCLAVSLCLFCILTGRSRPSGR